MQPIVDYPTLVEAVEETLMRQDLAEAVPTWIGLCEANLNRDIRALEMNQTIRTRAETARIQLPDDWLEAVRVQTAQGERILLASLDELSNTGQYSGGGSSLSLASDPSFAPEYSQDPAGYDLDWNRGRLNEERKYAIEGEWMQLYPDPDLAGSFDLEMTYKARIPPLSDDKPTNWLVKRHPDIYLYGTLIHSAPYLVADDRINLWTGLYQQVLQTINQRSDEAQWSGSPLNRRSGYNMWS